VDQFLRVDAGVGNLHGVSDAVAQIGDIARADEAIRFASFLLAFGEPQAQFTEP
jgi:hypothetical protein